MFSKPVHPSIVKEISRRESILSGQKTFKFMGKEYPLSEQKDLLWTTGKMAQYRICSFGFVADPWFFGYGQRSDSQEQTKKAAHKLRLDHIFSSPQLLPDKYYEQYVRNSMFSVNFERIPGYVKPKIESLSIQNYGTFNSLRKIEFSFKVFDRYSFELYERLYAVVGIHITVEFWWSLSPIKEMLPIENEQRVLSIFETGEQMKKVYEHNGNYEATIGRISSFEYKKDNDSIDSWTMSVTAISPQMNALYVTNDQKPMEYVRKHFLENEFITTFMSEKVSNEKCNYVHLTREKIKNKLFPNVPSKTTLNNANISSCIVWFGSEHKFLDKEKKESSSKRQKSPPEKKKEKEEKSVTIKRALNGKVFVSLGYIEDLISLACLNEQIAMSEFLSVRRLFFPKGYSKESMYQETSELDLYELVANSEYFFSYDSGVSILPKESPLSPIKFNSRHEDLYFDLKKEHLKQIGFPDSDSGLLEGQSATKFILENLNRFGVIRNILVNVQVVKEILESRPFSLESFMESLLIKLNESLMPITEFSIGVDDTVLGRISIRENNVFLSRGFPTVKFRLNQPNSIVYSADIKVKPSDTIINAMSISAMYSSSKIANFNLSGGVGDFIQELISEKTSGSQKAETIESLENELKRLPKGKDWDTQRKEIQNKLDKLKTDKIAKEKKEKLEKEFEMIILTTSEVSEDYKSMFREFARKYVESELIDKTRVGKVSYEYTRPVFPLEIELEIEGISGILFGDYIVINGLPVRYQDRCYFIVKGVSHEFVNSNWKTKLECLSVIKD